MSEEDSLDLTLYGYSRIKQEWETTVASLIANGVTSQGYQDTLRSIGATPTPYQWTIINALQDYETQ